MATTDLSDPPVKGDTTGAPARGNKYASVFGSGPSDDLPDFSTVNSGASTAEEAKEQKHSWWRSFLHKTFDIGHYSQPAATPEGVKEFTRSGVTGVTNVVAQGAQTVTDVLTTTRNIMASGDPLIPESKKTIKSPDVAGAIERGVAKVIGKAQDDGPAHVVESITQLVGSVYATRAAGIKNVLAEGAVSFGAFFDPHEGGFSELLKSISDNLSPGVSKTVLGTVGELGSVDADTPGLVARLKRAGEGLGLAVPFELAGWFARVSGLTKLFKSAGTEAEKAAIAAKIEEASNKIEELQSKPKAVSVEERPDGTFTLKSETPTAPAPQQELKQDVPNAGGRPNTSTQQFYDKVNESLGMGPGEEVALRGENGEGGVRLILSSRGPDVVEVKTIQSLEPTSRAGKATKAMQAVTQAADEHGVTLVLNASPFGEGEKALSREQLRDFYRKFGFEQVKSGEARMIRRPGEGPVAFRETPQVTEETGPVFASRADAETLANRANETVEAQARATDPILFTDEQVKAHGEIADRILNAPTGDDAARLAGGSHFNFDYLAGPDRVKAQIEAVAEQFGERFHAARVTEGVTVEEAFKKAQTLAAQYGIEDFAARFNAKSEAVVEFYADLLASHAAISELGQKLSNLYDVFRVRPDDPVLFQNAKNLLEMWSGLLRDTAGAESGIARTQRFMQERNNPLMAGVKFAEGAPKEAAAAGAKAASKAKTLTPEQLRAAGDVRGFLSADMTPERVEDWLRMFKMADGDVRYAPDVLAAQKIVDAVPKELVPEVSRFVEQFFMNSLISGVKTQQTIAATGFALQSYEAMMRVFGGIGSGNVALAREGADQLYSFFAHALDDMKGGAAAVKAGHSIIDPPLALHARGGLTNRIIQAPGDLATGLDERTRLSSFRAIVRAKSLRLAREEGLTGAALAQRVDRDVRLALGDGTGIAQNMLALKQARLPTLSGSLGQGTIGAKISDLVSSIPFFRLVTPFVNVGIHSMRYVNKTTPLLNLFYKDVRATLANGGEDAAVLYAKMATTSAMFASAYHLASTGVITGRGPSNPRLRREWNRQPYSVMIDGKDVSYRRFDPFASYLGIAADLATLHAEANSDGSDDETMGQATQAVLASYMSNVVNKTYMVGLSNFLKAASEQDGTSLNNFLGSIAAGFVPRAVQQFNTDSLYRESRGFVDRLMNATPGLSDNLPASYKWDGTPSLRGQGMWNRQGSIFPSREVTPSLEDKLVDNGIVLSSPPTSDRFAGIDYNDKEWSTDGSRPYERWMELIEQSGIRKTLEQITESEAWKNAPAGSPGSGAKKRAVLLQSRLDAVQEQAFHKMLNEPRYRKLKAAWTKSRALGAQNMQGGASAVDSLKNVVDSIRTSPPQATEAVFAQ